MTKIPVWRTIGQTYSFAFGHYLTLLGIVWLPFLASAAITYYLRLPAMTEMMSGHAHGSFAFNSQFERTNLLAQFIGLILFAIISVGVTKDVLGLRRGWRFFYAGFGMAELRVIAGYFALVLLFIVFMIGFVLGVVILAMASSGIVGAGGTAAAKGLMVLGLGVVAIGFWLSLIFIFVRLTFLFLPATVAENRIGILRSWELTHGNFWRIFLIGFVVFLPIIFLSFCFGAALLGPGYFDFVMQHLKDQDAIQAYVMERMRIFYENMPLVLAVAFIINPIVYGLTIGAPSFAYRALVPSPVEDVPVAAEPPPAEEKSDLPEEIQDVIGPEKLEEH